MKIILTTIILLFIVYVYASHPPPHYCDEYKPYCPKGYECNFKVRKCQPPKPIYCQKYPPYCPKGYVCNPKTKKCVKY
ncbi:hypothetical protein Mgra_00003035 [Meloidogyne graminicola]|uniref:Uncharacterized protein n=1 Tax=Meloidogyne graminicola TaxID=189291 RepID=A0A8S9ZV72_9BILA|nr:hypothetical protein Mgra_00003035 [Meloidogyne graminicola]